MFNQMADQTEVYSKSMPTLVDAFLQGYNASCIAYGQTGSGKTHTMGTADEWKGDSQSISSGSGVIPRAVCDIFSRIHNEAVDARMTLSFVEIYNEGVYDLLGDGEMHEIDCKLREGTNGAVVVQGAWCQLAIAV